MHTQLTLDDIQAAHRRIAAGIYRTPLEESLYLCGERRRYFFKLESLQTVRSFKIRGALSKMTTLTAEARENGVATVSSGNHGSAVAYAAARLGIEKAVIIVPENTPQAKTDRIAFYGGEVLRLGRDYDEAHRLGMAYIEEHGLTFIDAYYEDPLIYAGQGTIALEILDQNPEIDTIVCPIGGGGLITGIASAAKALKPDIRIIGVQTEACPAMIASLRENVFYKEYPVTGDTVCDALVGGVGKLSYELLGGLLDDIIEVKEETIRRAVKHMILNEKHIAEGGSCTTVAAVMDEPERVGGTNIALVISGGNIDAELIRKLVSE
ncbi:MAG: threonine/serine dehydratase [Solobacterium sp.]|nr:threonine/serine dehydratase [Solobacterium sp.]